MNNYNKMKEMNENILKVFSSVKISYMADVNKTININKYGEFKYFNIEIFLELIL